MGKGAKQDKDMPDGVEVRFLVVGEEVGPCRISDTFGKEEPKGGWCQKLNHRFGNENDAPAHHQVDSQRESRPAVHREDFIEGSAYHDEPLERKDRPAQPAAHYPDENRGVGTGYHDVDADVVALAKSAFQFPFSHPMIHGTAQEHKEHAEQETDDAERHLPANVGCQPNEPDAAQGKEGSGKVRPGVA